VAVYINRYLISPKGDCVIASIGDQFLLLLISDFTVGNILDMLASYVMYKIAMIRGPKGKGSNESVKPDFDVAEEYLRLLYRQFVVCLGMPIFPWLPLLGIICHIVDYKVSKYILLNYCQQTYHLRGSMKKFLTFYLFCTAILAGASFPFGAAWILTNYTFSRCAI